MENVLRATIIYFVAWLLFRVSGKRTLAQLTPFDAVLILIVSETTQSALVDSDHSITGAIILILTFVGIDVGLSYLKYYSKSADKLIDGEPVVLLDSSGLKRQAMDIERVDVEDILAAARRQCEIESLDEIRMAILEQSGDISILPKRSTKSEECMGQ